MTISLEQAKTHIRVTHESEDALITAYAAAATGWAAWYCGERYAGDAPEIVAAELLLTGHFYANREAVGASNVATEEMPLSVRALLAPYRKPVVA